MKTILFSKFFLCGFILMLFPRVSASLQQPQTPHQYASCKSCDLVGQDFIRNAFICAAQHGFLSIIEHVTTNEFLREELDFKSINAAFLAADMHNQQAVVAYFIANDFLCDMLDFRL